MKDLVSCKNMDFHCPLLKIEEIDCEMKSLKYLEGFHLLNI